MAPANPPYSGVIDARDRGTGRVSYTINLEAPNMAYAKLLRSRLAHARLVRIDTSRARQVPGVIAVVTGEELAQRKDVNPRFGPVFRDQPMLAIGKVRYVGEPVVAVLAEDLDVAQEALDLVDVEYEELPAVFDAVAALQPGAPLVHEEPPPASATFADLILNTASGTNVCNHFKLRRGDVERAFAGADHVFEDTFSSPPVQHVPLETHAVLARFEGGHLVVTASNQMPHTLRAQLAAVMRLPLTHVRVIVPMLGGGYGAKGWPSIEPIAAVLAYLSRRPVKLHLTREEEFVTITKHGVTVVMKTGVGKDMRLVARKATCYFNTGAYADIGPRLVKNGGFGMGGPYDIPNVWVDSYAVYTNRPPAGAFRGYGVSQAAWAYETQMDMIAERLGWDPYELRMRNLLLDGQRFATGEVLHGCHWKALLETAASKIQWNVDERPQRSGLRVRAKGLSCIVKGTVTPSTSTASVKLNEDGSLDILTSAVEMGQGVQTALAILAAEKLDLPVERVHVSNPDTDVTPYDQGTSSSRSSFAMGGAVVAAMDEIRRQLLEAGAAIFEVSTNDLEIVRGQLRVKGAPDRAATLGSVVERTRQGNLLADGTYTSEGGLDPETGQGIGSVHYHQAAGAAEVEVDLETGKVDVLRYHAAVYAGRVINPVQAELQTEGNVAFGLGQALFEELVYDHGQLQNGNLGDYLIASMEDFPRDVGSHLLESEDRDEIHGVGEPSLPPVMPAIGNAVFRATGVRITDLPITPEKILRGLRAVRATEAGTTSPAHRPR